MDENKLYLKLIPIKEIWDNDYFNLCYLRSRIILSDNIPSEYDNILSNEEVLNLFNNSDKKSKKEKKKKKSNNLENNKNEKQYFNQCLSQLNAIQVDYKTTKEKSEKIYPSFYLSDSEYNYKQTKNNNNKFIENNNDIYSETYRSYYSDLYNDVCSKIDKNKDLKNTKNINIDNFFNQDSNSKKDSGCKMYDYIEIYENDLNIYESFLQSIDFADLWCGYGRPNTNIIYLNYFFDNINKDKIILKEFCDRDHDDDHNYINKNNLKFINNNFNLKEDKDHEIKNEKINFDDKNNQSNKVVNNNINFASYKNSNDPKFYLTNSNINKNNTINIRDPNIFSDNKLKNNENKFENLKFNNDINLNLGNNLKNNNFNSPMRTNKKEEEIQKDKFLNNSNALHSKSGSLKKKNPKRIAFKKIETPLKIQSKNDFNSGNIPLIDMLNKFK